MILVFDTSALSKILGRDLALIKLMSRNNFTDYVLPLATDAELRNGFADGSRESANLIKYENIKHDYGLRLVCPDQETVELYAQLATYCEQHGFSLSHNDLWIAATCVQSGAMLLTLDADFANLPQLSLAKW